MSDSKPLSSVPIDMPDMQLLQMIQDKLHQASHLLNANATAASALSASLLATSDSAGNLAHQCNRSEMDQLGSLINEFEMHGKRVRTLLDRAGSVNGLVSRYYGASYPHRT